jgi:hypothetical protein
MQHTVKMSSIVTVQDCYCSSILLHANENNLIFGDDVGGLTLLCSTNSKEISFIKGNKNSYGLYPISAIAINAKG